MAGISAILTFLVVGLLFGWRKDRREAREAEGKAQQALDEAQRKAQELALAAERAERETAAERRAQAAFDEERQARPSAELIGGPTLDDGILAYTFRIVNRGKVFADNVTVWLVDTWGSQLGGEPVVLAQMVEPNEAAEVTLHIPADVQPPLRLYSSWRDTSGLHQHESWVKVPAPKGPGRDRDDAIPE
jgi:hypothetical protein